MNTALKELEFKPKVLIAEDDRNILLSIKIALESTLELEIITAENGQEAIEKAETMLPDMLILDIKMPKKDGFEVCEYLKNKKETKHIPIMFLTAEFTDIKSKAKGLDLGADDYLLKPFDPLELISRVKVMLRLREAQLRLEQKNRHYMDVVQIIAHDLRNPLSSIMTGAETLKNGIVGRFTPEQERMIDIMDRNANVMLDMIECFLNLSKLEKGEMTPEIRTFDFYKEIVLPIIEGYELLLQKKNKKVILADAYKPGTFVITSDLQMLKSVILNLFSNAIKYSDERGLINIKISINENKLIFEIENSSFGLREEEMQKMFQKFGRLRNNPLTAKEKGSGLGLFNSREILKILNGEIKCESVLGESVKFIVTLPLEF